MKADELPMRGLGDARLAIHAAGNAPAWLWQIDGTGILWANPVGARQFGTPRVADLTRKTFGPADPHRRQVMQLAARLRMDGLPRLERLRGFGAPLGRLVTCGCTRLKLADGREAILIVAVEAIGRPIPLSERLQLLVEDAVIPLAAFGRDGVFVGASDVARTMLGFHNLSEAGLDAARDDALRTGRTEIPIGLGHLVLQRVGSGADIGFIALLEPGAVPAPITKPDAAASELKPAMQDPQQAEPADPLIEPTVEADTSDAPPDFELVDEFETDIPLEPFPDFETLPIEPITHETIAPRSQPLRFIWEIDSREHFSIASDELLDLVGPQAATLDAPWQDIASAYASYGRMASAIASRAAWSGISLSLPVDDADEQLVADLSGIPTYRDGEFSGYRGFGVVYDIDALNRLDRIRRHSTDSKVPQSLSAHTPSPPFAMDAHATPEQGDGDTSASEDFASVDTPANVLHFRMSADGRAPVLTPVENHAFNELARELAARLEADHAASLASEETDDSAFDDAAEPLVEAENINSGARALLDLAPAPMAVHRDGRILYANAAFLDRHGAAGLADLQASGLDISAISPAREVALDWDGEFARAVIFDPILSAHGPAAAPEAGAADAEDLGAILDAADEAILMFDVQGSIRACNRSAAKLFGVGGDALVARDLAALFTPDTQAAIAPLLERLSHASQQQTVEARTIVGGHELPLKVTLGRARPEGSNYYAIVRDLTPLKRTEADLAQARRQSARTSADKADILARISHEMRSPLGAIIGFADVMIEQRFGPLGNERYADYLRDIRGCGERVIAIVDDLLDLSLIESGKRDLALAPQDLNHLVEQCVATMQPQANRERIIIRSSLAHPLPSIVADQASLRQITLNLIGNSIHLANAGGQVIVSTVHADNGDVLLRVRDTGHGLNDNEMAAALAPFRTTAEDADAPAQIRLSLTRALAEANRARFSLKPAPYAGSLIEVAFSPGDATT